LGADAPIDGGLASAIFATNAMDSAVIPRRWQYGEPNQTARSLAPLLALQDEQQRAMFSLLMMRASLTMCSQVGLAPRDSGADSNDTPQ